MRKLILMVVVFLFARNGTAHITNENQQLFLYHSPTDKIPLFAASENEFYSITQFLNIRFKYDTNRKVTGAEVEMFGNSMSVKKQ